ncbi:histone H1 [Pedobacter sp. SL55]|uniref:histone H1 n=1 Tax=Pedobacter sp. SL55 TaxID=2995161 RepID=UPI00226FDB7C|nr:histone H1 [Pedobacter sp. SL55]WAC39653.1 histone H1 [Pedobacter sp. SL55]
MEKFAKVKEVVAAIEADVEKFYNAGNSAAGTRVRKAMQDLKGLAQEIRTEVTEKKIAQNS